MKQTETKLEGGLRTKGLPPKKSVLGYPLVSIITVVRNSKKYLEETIKSVIYQTYNNFEYIIIDGGSTDGTLDLIKKYDDHIDYWVSEPDEGMYDAINKGLSISSGDILAYINSDDVYTDDKVISKVVAFFNTNKKIYWVYSDFYVIDSYSIIINSYRIPTNNYKMLASSNWSTVPQPTTFWRKEVIERCGGFNKELKMAADYEFFLKIGQKFKSKKLNFKVAKIRYHENSLTNKQQSISKVEQQKIIETNKLNKTKFAIFYRSIGYLLFKIYNFDNYIRRTSGKR